MSLFLGFIGPDRPAEISKTVRVCSLKIGGALYTGPDKSAVDLLTSDGWERIDRKALAEFMWAAAYLLTEKGPPLLVQLQYPGSGRKACCCKSL